MKALQIIAALCIVSSFSLNSMDNKKYGGLSMYHPRYHAMSTTPHDVTVVSQIYFYCNPTPIESAMAFVKGKKINPQNCEIINEYLLQEANFPDKAQDKKISKEQVTHALINVGAYNRWEMDCLEEAVENAHKWKFFDNNK